MNVSNFSPGLIGSAAYSNLRDVSAADAENVRNDADGALIVRKGMRELPADGDRVVSIFAHWSHVLVVTAEGELKWETETAVLSQTPTLFRSFIPARTGFDENTTFIAYDNFVFASDRDAQVKVVFDTDVDPVAVRFYLPPLGAFSVIASDGSSEDTVYLRFQPIKTLSQDADHFWSYPIEAVGRSALDQTRVPNDSFIDIQITADTLRETDADYIDVFQSLSTAANSDTDYYFIGRIPYTAGTHRLSTTTDTDIELERTLIEPIAEPDWQIIEATTERLYMTTENSSRIYMTYYDSSEQYLRSVTDFFDVKTDGQRITGLKTINENLLSVYTANRIYLVATDPIAELHRVLQTITTRDHRDAPIGCIAPESLVDINGEHYFLSGTRQVYKFSGQRPIWVSEPINPILEKIPRSFASQAVGFARDMEYCLSYPSVPESRENDAMLVYHTQYKTWWKDNLNLTDISKGQTQLEYAVINETPVLLNTGALDRDTPIEWLWKGNKILLPLNTLIYSLFIGVLPEDIGDEPVTVTVTLKTEEGEQTGELEVHRGLNFWEQFVGFNLRGRSVQVTLSGEGAMKIDRLEFNPEP